MHLNLRRCFLSIAVLALLAAGCGDDDDDDATDAAETTEATEAPATTEATTTTAGAAAEDQLGLAESDLGQILVDGEGHTLYKFDGDEPNRPEPTCYDGCAEAWPPLVTEGEPSVGEGLDESLVGTVERTDGTTQVTYNDWPLYHFSGDAAPGETNGQGVGGTWHVVGADGEPIRE